MTDFYFRTAIPIHTRWPRRLLPGCNRRQWRIIGNAECGTIEEHFRDLWFELSFLSAIQDFGRVTSIPVGMVIWTKSLTYNVLHPCHDRHKCIIKATALGIYWLIKELPCIGEICNNIQLRSFWLRENSKRESLKLRFYRFGYEVCLFCRQRTQHCMLSCP